LGDNLGADCLLLCKGIGQKGVEMNPALPKIYKNIISKNAIESRGMYLKGRVG
jgi:hypothetical protein